MSYKNKWISVTIVLAITIVAIVTYKNSCKVIQMDAPIKIGAALGLTGDASTWAPAQKMVWGVLPKSLDS
jgi:hypothetical protein